MHLHRQRCDFQTHFGAVALDQRHHELVKGLVVLAHLRIGMVVGSVKGRSGHAGHGPATFHISAHRHEHAAHIGMVDDGCTRANGAVDRAALHPVLRKTHGRLVRPFRDGYALDAHAVTGGVHHDEHVLQTAVFLTDQIAHRTAMVAKLQHCGGACLDSHLVLNADAMHIVGCTQCAIGIDLELGHDEQADALHTLWRALYPGQHQMNDVLGHVVLTPGDEDLGTKDVERTIGQRLGTGTHRCQITASLRLGEVHGAGPLAADQLLQVNGLEFVGPGGQKRFNRTIAEQRAQGKTHVGAVGHLATHRTNRLGQSLSTIFLRMLQTLPATINELLERFLESRRCGDDAVLPAGRVFVAFPVQRRKHALVELRTLFQHRLRGVEPGVFKPGNLGDLCDVGQMLDVEQHIFHGCNVAHNNLQKNKSKAMRFKGRKKRASRTMPLCW